MFRRLSFTTATFLGADEEIQDFSLPWSLFLFPSHYVYTITGSRPGPGRGVREGTAGQRAKAISATTSGYRTLDLRDARVSLVARLFAILRSLWPRKSHVLVKERDSQKPS